MDVIRCRHIKIVQQNIGNGITEPKLATTDENTLVVIKTFNGPEGPLVLFNEYFCYRLAVLVNLEMPESGVCLLDKDTEILNSCVNEKQLGYGFYSTYLNKSVILQDSIVPLINNKDEFYRIILFDHIIYNKDRNPGNLLVRYYKKDISLKVIDHSHVFINEAIWNAECLNRAMQEKDYYSIQVLKENSYLYSMFFEQLDFYVGCFDDIINEFKEKISEKNIRKILNDIPLEWMPPQKDVEALVRYIEYRMEHIEEICTTILSYIQ